MFKLHAFESLYEYISIEFEKHNPPQNVTLLWTMTGLLAVCPKSDDYLYFNRNKNINENQNERRTNGSYLWSYELSFQMLQDKMTALWSELLRDLLKMEEYGATPRGYRAGLNAWDDETSRKFKREIRFLVFGYFCGGYSVPMALYQFLICDPSFGSLILRANYVEEQEKWLADAILSNSLVSSEIIVDSYAQRQRELATGVSFFGRFSIHMKPTIFLRSSTQQQAGAVALRGSIVNEKLESMGMIRRINIQRNLNINEATNTSIEVHPDDTVETIHKLTDAAARYAGKTSILRVTNAGAVTRAHASNSDNKEYVDEQNEIANGLTNGHANSALEDWGASKFN